MLRGPHIETVIKRFFDENATTIRSKATRAQWSRILRRLQERYPAKRLNELTSADLRSFLLFEQDGAPQAAGGATIYGMRTCFRSFFSWCEFACLVDKDPSAVLVRTVKVDTTPTRQHYWLSEDEVSSLFDVCNADES